MALAISAALLFPTANANTEGPEPLILQARAPFIIAEAFTSLKHGIRDARCGSAIRSDTERPIRLKLSVYNPATSAAVFDHCAIPSLNDMDLGNTALEFLVRSSTSGWTTTTISLSGTASEITSSGSYERIKTMPPNKEGAALSA